MVKYNSRPLVKEGGSGHEKGISVIIGRGGFPCSGGAFPWTFVQDSVRVDQGEAGGMAQIIPWNCSLSKWKLSSGVE